MFNTEPVLASTVSPADTETDGSTFTAYKARVAPAFPLAMTYSKMEVLIERAAASPATDS
jgi:hypothetical protein